MSGLDYVINRYKPEYAEGTGRAIIRYSIKCSCDYDYNK